ncbi:MAG TPA: biopolymer transporter ExbD [Oligoflexales bacterium]|jgi:biopolymer transport protein ExbD|nr:biopolymer transporter ExbD [Oligoflexales bacterium]
MSAKKNPVVDLNLVPMIDLFIVCVTFLLMTAVWTQTGRIQVDQSVQKPQPKQEQTEPPKRLTIMVDAKGYMVKYAENQPYSIAKAGDGSYMPDKLGEHLKELELSKDQKVIVAPDDRIPYKDMITAMDACMMAGLENLVVADIDAARNEMGM